MSTRARVSAFALSSMLLLAVGGNSASAEALEFDAQPSVFGIYNVAARSLLDPIAINRMHSWELTITTSDGAPVAGAKLEISGGMPVHDHGLPTAPKVTKDFNNGTYLIEGIKFHMPGDWELVVDIQTPRGNDRAVFVFRL